MGAHVLNQIRQLFGYSRHFEKDRPDEIDVTSLGMETRRALLFTGLAGLPFFLNGCALPRRDRVRLTVTIESDGQLFSGSSVQ